VKVGAVPGQEEAVELPDRVLAVIAGRAVQPSPIPEPAIVAQALNGRKTTPQRIELTCVQLEHADAMAQDRRSLLRRTERRNHTVSFPDACQAGKSARRSPAVRQPVSSMFSALAARTRSSRSASGSPSESATRCQIASTVPVLILAPNSCSHSSTTSRRETRLRTDSTATAAWKRGPNALAATVAGSDARSRLPQPGQQTRGR